RNIDRPAPKVRRRSTVSRLKYGNTFGKHLARAVGAKFSSDVYRPLDRLAPPLRLPRARS
ncbi:MAG: hypothetical protein ABI369_14015, partial [Acetobacteraceae bacterium]